MKLSYLSIQKSQSGFVSGLRYHTTNTNEHIKLFGISKLLECNYLIVNGLESCIYWLHVLLFALHIDISISNLCHLKVISRTSSYHRCKVIRYSFPQVVQSLKNETQHYRYLLLYTFSSKSTWHSGIQILTFYSFPMKKCFIVLGS